MYKMGKFSIKYKSRKVVLYMKEYLGIESVEALEILDSRGNPTVQVEVVTDRRFFRSSVSSIRGINRKF